MNAAVFTVSALALLILPMPAEETKPPARPDTESAAMTNVSAAGAKKLIDEAGAQKNLKFKVLDVRTSDEFADGHIAGALNVDFKAKDFEEKLSALDRDTTWLLHCASGGRSKSSLKTLKKLGFKSIVHLDEGFDAWQKAGLPVEKAK
jgi:rhodanese-related sulfurtransferase